MKDMHNIKNTESIVNSFRHFVESIKTDAQREAIRPAVCIATAMKSLARCYMPLKEFKSDYGGNKVQALDEVIDVINEMKKELMGANE